MYLTRSSSLHFTVPLLNTSSDKIKMEQLSFGHKMYMFSHAHLMKFNFANSQNLIRPYFVYSKLSIFTIQSIFPHIQYCVITYFENISIFILSVIIKPHN